LEKLGFSVTGYGCQPCIGNGGELEPEVIKAIKEGQLITVWAISSNRNYLKRRHAEYLASLPLCVAYAIAGTVNFDFVNDNLGKD